ncbi:MAG: adenylate/guanylate cyclase domain-containing protein [Bacteroidota bacterium]
MSDALALEETIDQTQTGIEKIDALNAIALTLQNTDIQKARQLAEEALLLSEEHHYILGKAKSRTMLAICSCQTGAYPAAIQQAQEAFDISNDEDAVLQGQRLRALTIIGQAYYFMGDYSKALDYELRSLIIHERNGTKEGIAVSLGNIGLIYENIGDNEKALEYGLRSAEIEEKMGNKDGEAASLCNIGNVYKATGDNAKALEYYMKALLINEVTGNKQYEAICLMNTGSVYSTMGDYEKALEYLMKALAKYDVINDKYNKVLTLLHVGYLYLQKDFSENNPAKAIEFFKTALAIAEEINAQHRVFEAHSNLADAYAQLGDMAKAYEHFKKFHETEKAIFNEEANKKYQQLEYQKDISLMQQEQKLTNNLLNKIFPSSVVDRLRNGESPLADYYENTTVLFLDLVEFTSLSSKIPARHLLFLLNSIFSACDAVIAAHSMEKIKTIGDAYMAASGVPEQKEDHLEQAARASLSLMKVLKELVVKIPQEIEGDREWMNDVKEIQVRIGLHCGEVVGGVVGETKYAYDLWGDTVNIAARMEETGEPGKIHVSENIFTVLKDRFEFEERDEREIKGKGMMKTYFLTGEKTL